MQSEVSFLTQKLNNLRFRERNLMDELQLSSQREVSLRDDVQWGLKNLQGLRKKLDTAQKEVVRSRTRVDTLRDEVLSFNRCQEGDSTTESSHPRQKDDRTPRTTQTE